MPVAPRAALAGAFIALAQPLATYAHAEGPSKRECVAASEAGQGHRNAGQLLDARTKFRDCISPSCPRLIREDCAQRLAEVEQAIPTLVLSARNPAGYDLFAVTVRIDGESVTDHLGGKAFEVDPGEHKFTFEVQGEPSVDRNILVREGDKGRLLLVVIGSAVTPPPKPVAKSAGRPPQAPALDASTQRWVGITLGAVGVGAAGAGLVLSLLAKSTYDRAYSVECGGDAQGCTPQGAADYGTAIAEATGATVAFIAAGALVTGGAVLFFTAPHGARVTPAVGFRRAGLSLEVPW